MKKIAVVLALVLGAGAGVAEEGHWTESSAEVQVIGTATSDDWCEAMMQALLNMHAGCEYYSGHGYDGGCATTLGCYDKSYPDGDVKIQCWGRPMVWTY